MSWFPIYCLIVVIVTFFITEYRTTKIRYHWTLKPILMVSDFIWNVRNSKKYNYGHWMRSNEWGGRCKKCGMYSYGGPILMVLGPVGPGRIGVQSCKDVISYDVAKKVMES